MITSVNLAPIPFQSSTDSTRLNMSAKQIQQALTSLDCEIPYVLCENYPYIRDLSYMGILVAEDEGEVILNRLELFVAFYKNLNKFVIQPIPPIKKTHGNYASSLRNSLEEGSVFQRGQVLFEYDCFQNGIPSFGYNVFTGFFPFFGMNHEDSIVLSESFVNKSQVQFIDKVYIPIYEYSLMQKIYKDDKNIYGYLPLIGQQIQEDTVGCFVTPKNTDYIKTTNPANVKNRMIALLKNMNLSTLLSINSPAISNFSVEKVKTRVENGTVSGLKIHRLVKPETINMLDKGLEQFLNQLYEKYGHHILDVYQILQGKFNQDFVKKILKENFFFADKDTKRGNFSLKNAIYIIELEIVKQEESFLGDKFANRYANKGVVSLILPDKLRPIAQDSQLPIDFVFNPFGVFSRMNLGQLLEGMVGKNVMYCDRAIKNNPFNAAEAINWLNEGVIKYLKNDKYYLEVQSLIKQLKDDSFRDNFIQNVQETNLYIEAPAFSEVDVKSILKNGMSPNENVLIKKETIKYMKQKLKLKLPFPEEDITLKNIFCAPIYITKLNKLTKKIISSRDLGPVKTITKQPLRGRANEGGSRIGQMEVEGILAHGCDLALKELITVKNDWSEGKRDLIRQIVETGEYHQPKTIEGQGRTKQVIDVMLEFLKS